MPPRPPAPAAGCSAPARQPAPPAAPVPTGRETRSAPETLPGRTLRIPPASAAPAQGLFLQSSSRFLFPLYRCRRPDGPAAGTVRRAAAAAQRPARNPGRSASPRAPPPTLAVVDRRYCGHGVARRKVLISGTRRSLTATLKWLLRRRSAIEPEIGLMKNRRSPVTLPAEGRVRRRDLRGPVRLRPQPPQDPRPAEGSSGLLDRRVRRSPRRHDQRRIPIAASSEDTATMR